MIKLTTPISCEDIKKLKIKDEVLISGIIYTGRDRVLPKLVKLIEDNKVNEIPFDLEGNMIMHTAVSDAGIATTTSNKKDIESSIKTLSENGIKGHIGKGALSEKTKKDLDNGNSVYFVSPPVAALLTDCVKSKKCVMFSEEGMEAIYELEVENIPGIVAIANGESIY